MTCRTKTTIKLLEPNTYETGEDLFWKGVLNLNNPPSDFEIETYCNYSKSLLEDIILTEEENSARINSLKNLQVSNYDQETQTVELLMEFPSEEVFRNLFNAFNPTRNTEIISITTVILDPLL